MNDRDRAIQSIKHLLTNRYGDCLACNAKDYATNGHSDTCPLAALLEQGEPVAVAHLRAVQTAVDDYDWFLELSSSPEAQRFVRLMLPGDECVLYAVARQPTEAHDG